jgi:hypothetical protein
MQRGPIKRFGSLRRRVEQAGLASLRVTCDHVRPARLPSSRRQWPLVISLRTIVLLLLLGVFVVVISMALRLAIGSPPAPAHLPAPPMVIPVVHRALMDVDTPENVEDLAQILMSEASPGVANTTERVAVGCTVLNRLRLSRMQRVKDVWDAYAHHATPTDEVSVLAVDLLRGELADPTSGATHFYSPRSMPMEGDTVRGFDISGGLEQTLGLRRQNYRPGWAAQYEIVAVVGTRASHYKFYRQPTAPLQE